MLLLCTLTWASNSSTDGPLERPTSARPGAGGFAFRDFVPDLHVDVGATKHRVKVHDKTIWNILACC